jgi:hypothetical protein
MSARGAPDLCCGPRPGWGSPTWRRSSRTRLPARRASATWRRGAALEVDLARQRTQVEDLRVRAETIAANRKDARRFMESQMAPPDASVVPILTEVESLAREAGPAGRPPDLHAGRSRGLRIERFGIVMPVDGTYRQLTGLVAELETAPKFLTSTRCPPAKG